MGANPPARPMAARRRGRRPTPRSRTSPRSTPTPASWNRAGSGRSSRSGRGPAVAVIDLEKNAVVETWPTAEHPTEMVLSPKGDALYVACANSTRVSVLDPAIGQGLADHSLRALSERPQRQHAQQPGADARRRNALRRQRRRQQPRRVQCRRPHEGQAARASSPPAGIRPRCASTRRTRRSTSPTARGSVRTPTATGRTRLQPRARNLNEYIGELFTGTLGIIKMPTPAAMATYTKQAYACSPLRDKNAVRDGRRRGRQPDPAQGRRPEPDQVLRSTSSRRTGPTTRSSAT